MNFTIEPGFIESFAIQKLRENDIQGAMSFLEEALILPESVSADDKFLLYMRMLDGSAKTDTNAISFDNTSVIDSSHPIFQKAENLKNRVDKLETEKAELVKALSVLTQKFCFIEQNLSGTKKQMLADNYRTEYGDSCLFREEPKSILSSFIEHMQSECDEPDYGWLSPTGDFIPVEWAKHQQFASDYCREHYPMDKNLDLYVEASECNGHTIRRIKDNMEIMEEKGWILIHSPYQGQPHHEVSAKCHMTKAQRDFLYDFYSKRNMTSEANAVVNET